MKLLIDAFFFQLARSGIARVWTELLSTWQQISPDHQFYVLDRGQKDLNLGRVEIISFQPVPVDKCWESSSLEPWDNDRTAIDNICTNIGIDIFLPTYYTYSSTCKTILLVHDMIPENNSHAINLNEPIWKMKVQTIYNSSGYVCVSRNTAVELMKHYNVEGRKIIVAHNGTFGLYQDDNNMELPHSLLNNENAPYPFVLVPGLQQRGSYKNQDLIFRALRKLYVDNKLKLVATGKSGLATVNTYKPYSSSPNVLALFLSEEQLASCYKSCLAVLYPSREEGFGLPVIEAIANGTVPVTCPNSSLLEVGGPYAIYISEDDESSLFEIVEYLMNNSSFFSVQVSWNDRLRSWAKHFDWNFMCRRFDAFVRQEHLENIHSRWMEGHCEHS